MIQVVMFDLGGTLVDAARHTFPLATDALAFAKANWKICLVSDFSLAPPATVMPEYLEILTKAGLKSYFEPVEKKVTLSNHAGVNKPKEAIFKMALKRLGVPAVPLSGCVLVTEDSAHVQEVRSRLGMKALQFQKDFKAWRDFPAKIAELHAPAGVWVPLHIAGHEDLDGVLVEIPEFTEEQKNEAHSYVLSLADNQQIAGRRARPATRATHEIETDAEGNRKLVRRRFSAF